MVYLCGLFCLCVLTEALMGLLGGESAVWDISPDQLIML